MRAFDANTRAHSARRLVAALVVVITLAACGARVSLAQTRTASASDYRARVLRAADLLEGLAQLEASTASSSGRASSSRASENLYYARAQVLADVRAALPQTERVARAGGAQLEVDNRWLYTKLQRYERESAEAFTRAESLRRIAERLRAVAERLREVEAATASTQSARNKEAEKGRLAAILRHPDYAERRVEETALDRLLETIAKWLRELLPESEPLRPGASGGASLIAQAIIYGLVVLLIVLVFRWYWLRRPPKKAKERRGPRVILGETIAEDETAADLLVEAERLAASGNLRGAIRKAYVALLCELGDRRVLRLAGHKTNRDYLQSVRDFAPQLYTLFQPLTYSFERHWYGLAPATEEDWNNFRSVCGRALQAK